jgi:hypothetical protein
LSVTGIYSLERFTNIDFKITKENLIIILNHDPHKEKFTLKMLFKFKSINFLPLAEVEIREPKKSIMNGINSKKNYNNT